MIKLLIMLFMTVGVMYGQLGGITGNARRLQGTPIKSTLSTDCTDGNILIWVAANNRWECGTGDGSALTVQAGASGGLTVNRVGDVVTVDADDEVIAFQDLVNTWTAANIFTNGRLRLPSSTTLPAECAVGEIYMDTDATTGQRLYACESTDTWVLQGDGGGHDAVTLAGTPDYITLSGQQITRNAINLATSHVTGILPGANGGTGNGFFAVSGPTSTLKTFTFPNASATVLTTDAAVTVAQGGTGLATITSNRLVKGAGTSAMVVTGVEVDSSDNVTTPGSVTATTGITTGDGSTPGVWTSRVNATDQDAPAADYLRLYPKADGWYWRANGGSATKVPRVISGTSALGTAEIASGACATVVTTSATGVASTDAITWTPNADISAVTGYATAGFLRIYPYPTTDNVNFKVCNAGAGAVTPGAVTLNWSVVK